VTVTGEGIGGGIGWALAVGLTKQMIPATPAVEAPSIASQARALTIISPPPLRMRADDQVQ